MAVRLRPASSSACASRSLRLEPAARSPAPPRPRAPGVSKSPTHQAMRARTSSAVNAPVVVGSGPRAPASISSVACRQVRRRAAGRPRRARSAHVPSIALSPAERASSSTRAHLDRDRRQVAQAPRRARRVVAALERRLELDRAQEQLAARSGSPRGRARAGPPPRARPRPRRRAPPAPRRRARRAAASRGRGGRRGSRAARRPPAPGATRRTAGGSSARSTLVSPAYATSRMSMCLKRNAVSPMIVERGSARTKSRSSRSSSSASTSQLGCEVGDRAVPEDRGRSPTRGAAAAFSAGGSRSMRAAISAWSVSGIRRRQVPSPLSAQHPHRLLDEQRVALGLLEQLAPRLGGQLRVGRQSRSISSSASPRAQRLELDRGRRACGLRPRLAGRPAARGARGR